jgi:L-Ala-D/L-Glu epimerase
MTRTTIHELTVEPLDIPLKESFGIAGGGQQVAQNLLVTIVLADGTRGYGEAAPLPAFNAETQELAQTALENARTSVEGADVREWRRIAAELRTAACVDGKCIGSARCALETAILDALTRQAQMPLWAFFGGVTTRLETDMTVTIQSAMSPEEAIAHAARSAREIRERGIRSIKTKVGTGNHDLDLARIVAIRDSAPDATLILDGNCGFAGAEEALRLLRDLEAKGIRPALFEQPVKEDDWVGLDLISREGNVLVAADESVKNVKTAMQAANTKAVAVVNIKLMKCGVAEALDIVAICRAAGLRFMIGGMIESKLAMSMSACFAAGLGGFDFVDLDTPLFMLSDPFLGGYHQSGGMLDLNPIEAGHGVQPK